MTLFYFTESFPYGIGEHWKKNEIEFLANSFDKIVVIPLWNGKNPNPLSLNLQNVEVLKPTLQSYPIAVNYFEYLKSIDKTVIKEILLSGSISNKSNLVKALSCRVQVDRLLNSDNFKYLSNITNSNTIWYFFWGKGWADIIPFCNDFERKKVIVKMHGYDLYEERNNGYIPYREQLFRKVDKVITISEFGRNYLNKRYNYIKDLKLVRLGTKHYGQCPISNDKIIRIVSCSSVVPVKRLDRIIEVFKSVDSSINIEWTHIGDGPLLDQIKLLSNKLPSNIKAKFVGLLSFDQIIHYYHNNEVDLFINTSESEGVPVSIMEALSFGIPVIATNVGGTKEILNDDCGALIEEANLHQFVKYIHNYYHLTKLDKNKLRENAFKMYNDFCNVDLNNQILHNELINMN